MVELKSEGLSKAFPGLDQSSLSVYVLTVLTLSCFYAPCIFNASLIFHSLNVFLTFPCSGGLWVRRAHQSVSQSGQVQAASLPHVHGNDTWRKILVDCRNRGSNLPGAGHSKGIIGGYYTWVSYMKIIHGYQIWVSYMGTRYGYHTSTWVSCMGMVSRMAIIDGHHTWVGSDVFPFARHACAFVPFLKTA